MPRILTPLTDDQLAAIAWADPTESTASLARRIGAEHATVAYHRNRIRRAGGWFCVLDMHPCAICGRPVAANPQAHRRVHPACAQIRHAQRHRHERSRKNAETRPIADQHGQRWTSAEEAVLLDDSRDLREVAKSLGRTWRAVEARRQHLRRQGETPAPAGRTWEPHEPPPMVGPAHGERNAAAKLTEDQVREIKRRFATGGVTYAELARAYGVNYRTVSAIINGKLWRHVEEVVG